ncbi:helix-turn-helix domain-containing protein [Marinicella meishanensis]|uniref:helix-turn-helix domain-containing protein n=1 Tax=Marinicella meishanensis TaxID=2873263 RepID=UPI001CBD7D79|nr:helix-turn-helix transcriptional regulator [Marinicella sp. NBU2979]
MKKLCATQSYQLPALRQYVDSVSFYRNEHHQDSQSLLFEGCPEGVFELIFQSDNSVWQKDRCDGVWRRRDEAFLGGLHQQGYQLKLPPDTEIMSVRFKHGAFKYVFSGRLNDFMNQKVPISELWSRAGVRLQNKLKQCADPLSKLHTIADFLEPKVHVRQHSVIDQSVQAILSCQGMVDMVSLERQSALSTAQFRKRFREEVGLSPKKYAKVIKVNAILSAMERAQGHQKLTDIVYDFGYFDQSHFIKDFKSVVGKTPSKYLSA